MHDFKPVDWVANQRAATIGFSAAVAELFPPGTFNQARSFHCSLPAYRPSPLKNLARLAAMIGVGGIWVKDESARLSLNSFKVLGGSFAIYRHIKAELGAEGRQLSFAEMTADAVRPRLGDITFAAATDGNHGRGVAWSATQLGYESVIYVHKLTSQNRIAAIERNGARVVVVDGTWSQAGKLVRRNPRLAALPRYAEAARAMTAPGVVAGTAQRAASSTTLPRATGSTASRKRYGSAYRR